MRIAIRAVVVLAVLLVAALAALAFTLPSILDSDAVRARIESAAQDSLGREVRYAGLDFGLLPPSLKVMEPVVAGASAEAPPLVRADEVALRVALLPLLTRTVVVDSLVIDGAQLRLVRTPDGLELPTPAAKEAAGDEAPAAEGAGVALAVRRLVLSDATLVLEDRAVSPPVTWELRNVQASARGESLDAPVDFDLSAELASGGKLAAEGSATLSGDVDARLRLDGLALDPARPYLPDARELAGTLSGTVEAKGPAAELESIVADLTLDGARVALGDIALDGKLGVKAEIRGGLGRPEGPFEVDATRAALRYGDAFRKPAGREATLRGRLVTREDGNLGVEDAQLAVHNLKADASASLGKRTRVTARVAPFDLKGWEELIPALAGYEASGRVDVGQVQLATNPLDVKATINLDGVQATHPDAGRVTVKGSIVASGDAVDTKDLQLVAADQVVHVDAKVRDLGATPRFQVSTRTEKADTNRLVSAFTSRRDTFYGLLDFNGDISGRLGESLVRSLTGTTRLDVRDGRIVGLSLLRAVFAGLGEAGKAAQGLAALAVNVAALRAPELQRFYGEDFEALTGTFRLADGVARTDDLRIDYRSYAAQIDGRLGLEDSQYDFGCTVTLGPELAQVLARKLGGREGSLEQLTIPARLNGSLGAAFAVGQNPRVTVPPQAAVAFFRSVAAGGYGSKADKILDEKLGEGAGEQVRDVLDGILGGGGRR
jgi:uncharacterized protein involved in outer membrane biogenesis